MLSRVAESIYWLSRYIERAENVARVVGVNNQLQLDLPDLADEQWDPMVKVTGDDERFQAGFGATTRSNVIEFLTFDAANPNSIFSCLTRARENARSVREIISSEMWRRSTGSTSSCGSRTRGSAPCRTPTRSSSTSAAPPT